MATTVVTGISTTEAFTMAPQQRIAYVSGAYYAFYQDAYDVWYKKSTDYGGTWGSAVKVNTTANSIYQPSIYVDGTDIYITYNCYANDYIYLRVLDTTGDTLGTEQHTVDVGVIGNSDTNLVAVDSGGRIYIYNSNDPDFYYSDNGGVDWTSATSIHQDAAAAWSNMLCIGTDLHFFQNNGTNLEWFVYDGTTWSGTTTIFATGNPFVTPMLNLDKDDTIWLGVVDTAAIYRVWKKGTGDGGFTEKTNVHTEGIGWASAHALASHATTGVLYAAWVSYIDDTTRVVKWRKSSDGAVTWGDVYETDLNDSTFQQLNLSGTGTNFGVYVFDIANTRMSFTDLSAIYMSTSDSVSVAESAGLRDITNPESSESVTVTENVNLRVSDPQITTSDSISISEFFSYTYNVELYVSDGVGVAESQHPALVHQVKHAYFQTRQGLKIVTPEGGVR